MRPEPESSAPEGGPRHLSLEVPAALAGERVDRAVALLGDVTRSEAARLLEAGSVLIDGRPVEQASRRLKEHERLEMRLAQSPERPGDALPLPEPEVAFSVLYEDSSIVVVDKPAGVVVHPGAGQTGGTLAAGLLARYPELARLAPAGAGEPGRPGIVHRLDKDTSGVLVVARSAAAFGPLSRQMKRRRARRSYLAIVTGSLRAESGVIEAPIGRSARRRTSMAVSPEGRPARSFYRVIERFSRPLAASYLEVGLDTGRTHQIRVHLAAIGHPVLGDTRYGGRRGALPAARPMLHASALELEHPESGLQMSFTAPLPEDFLAILGRLS